MNSSYPFLNASRQAGIPYGEVIAFADKLQRYTFADLEAALVLGKAFRRFVYPLDVTNRAIINAELSERARRNSVMSENNQAWDKPVF